MRMVWILALALAAFPVAASAAIDAFVWFDGVPGSSSEPAHKGWVEAENVAFGGETHVEGANGVATGQRVLSLVTITKQGDAASASLLRLAESGAHLDKVQIDVVDRTGRVRSIYHLTDAIVTTVRLSGDGDRGQVEKVTLAYAHLAHEAPPAAN